MVTAKVTLGYVSPVEDGQIRLNFLPDYNDGRNKEWSKYTPNLNLVMTVLESVMDSFEVGASYTLQFVKEERNVGNKAA